jgi:hypothetical protein
MSAESRATLWSALAGFLSSCGTSTTRAAAEKQVAEEALASLPTQVTITRAQLAEWIDELG